MPSYGTKLNDSPAKVQEEWNATSAELQLATPPTIDLSAPAHAGAAAAPAQPVRPAKAANDMAL